MPPNYADVTARALCHLSLFTNCSRKFKLIFHKTPYMEPYMENIAYIKTLLSTSLKFKSWKIANQRNKFSSVRKQKSKTRPTGNWLSRLPSTSNPYVFLHRKETMKNIKLRVSRVHCRVLQDLEQSSIFCLGKRRNWLAWMIARFAIPDMSFSGVFHSYMYLRCVYVCTLALQLYTKFWKMWYHFFSAPPQL